MSTKDGNKDLQENNGSDESSNITNEDIENIEYTHEVLEKTNKRNIKWSRTATILSVIAIIIAVLFAGCSTIANNTANKCSNALSALTGKTVAGVNGLDGISAYQVWLNNGNSGSPEEFINSLVGKPGINGIDGTQGLDGIKGTDGLSIAGKNTYEVWLGEGNTGTVQDFLTSLVGKTGAAGIDGLQGESAYQLWLGEGNTGTVQDFLASLIGSPGVNGVPGINGINGASAYELWLAQGNTGDVDAFIVAITGAKGDTGATGAQGETGICTVGDTGAQGIQGEQGIQGPTGAQGVEGPAGQAFTLKGSYADLATFQAGAGANPGNAGDGWLLENDGSIMVWSIEQGWIDAGDIRGAQGPMGPQGIQGIQGVQGIQGIKGDTGTSISDTYYGSWLSENTQSAPRNTRTRMYFETETLSHGVTIVRGEDGQLSDITFTHDGVYNLQFSAQLHNTGGGGSGQNFIIWLGKDGNNVAASATDVTVNTNSPWVVASWNFFIEAKAGETAQLFYQVDNSNIVIQATTSNSVPAIPSVILTVNQIG